MMVSGLVPYHPALAPLMVDIDTVQQYPSNYNNGDVEAIAESIEVNGMYRPIFVQKNTGYIVAGNHTWLACKMLEATEIPVVYLDLDDHQARKLLVADNRTAQLAIPDDAELLRLLDKIAVDDGLEGTGWDDHTVELLRLAQEEAENTPLGYGPPDDPFLSLTCPNCGHTWQRGSIIEPGVEPT